MKNNAYKHWLKQPKVTEWQMSQDKICLLLKVISEFSMEWMQYE